MRFGALQETRALRPPQMVLPKKLDLRRPLPRSLRVKTCESTSWDHNPGTCDSWMDRLQRAPETCIPSGTRFRERTPRRLVRRNDRHGTHEQCGPGGWPGPHFILDFSGHRFSRISRIEQINIMNGRNGGVSRLDYSLFILLY